MSAQPQPRLSEQEYLAIERKAELKSEFHEGAMFAMAGGSPSHVLVITNLASELHAALKKTPCRVYSSDLRVRVAEGRNQVYPDVTVVCAEPKYFDEVQDVLVNPVFIAEVLSPSTEAYDRGAKSAGYRRTQSLQEYALIAQGEPRIEVYARRADGGWLLSEFVGLDARCRFESLGCEVALADIYAKVDFKKAV